MMVRPPRSLVFGLVATLGLLGTACGGDDEESGDAAATPGQVDVVDNEFKPSNVEIAPGDTVTWEFKGAVQHNVQGEGFKSKTQKDGTYERQFNSAGEYEYICTIHPGMTGKVTVG